MSSLSPRASSTASVRYLVLLVASALLIMTLMGGLSWFYSASATGYWPGYADMMGDWPSPLAWLRWVIGDISEVAFYKHEFASLGLLLGGALGYWASRAGRDCLAQPMAETRLVPHVCAAGVSGSGGGADLRWQRDGDDRQRCAGGSGRPAFGQRHCPAIAPVHAPLHWQCIVDGDQHVADCAGDWFFHAVGEAAIS